MGAGIVGRIGEDLVTGGLAEGYRAANGGEGLVDQGYDSLASGVDDASNAGRNRSDARPWGMYMNPDGSWTAEGAPGLGMGASDAWAHMTPDGQNPDVDAARRYGGWANDEMTYNRGPMAREEQGLSDREAMASGGDMSGALQLAREGAMGLSPSAAAYQMQQGLNTALANQSAIAGSARGAGALALAQGDAAANSANMSQNAFTEAGRLRAQEMANYANLYGNLAGQNVQQAQNRLQMGNQMSQYNANLNDQYRMGMGQLGNQYGQTALTGQNQQNQNNLGWFNAGAGVAGKNADLEAQQRQQNASNWNTAQGLNMGVDQAKADLSERNRDKVLGFIQSGAQIGGGMAGSAKK